MLRFYLSHDIKVKKNHIFLGMKKSRFCQILRNIIMDIIMLCYEICKPLVVDRFYSMALYHPKTQHHVINPDTIEFTRTQSNKILSYPHSIAFVNIHSLIHIVVFS